MVPVHYGEVFGPARPHVGRRRFHGTYRHQPGTRGTDCLPVYDGGNVLAVGISRAVFGQPSGGDSRSRSAGRESEHRESEWEKNLRKIRKFCLHGGVIPF